MTSYTVITIKPPPGDLGFTVETTGAEACPRIGSVNPDGNAFQAGLRVGQTILSVGPTPVTGMATGEIHELIERLAARFGDVTLHVTDDHNSDCSDPQHAGEGDRLTSGPVVSTQEPSHCFNTGEEGHLPLVRKHAYRSPVGTDEFNTVDSKSTDGKQSPVSYSTTLMDYLTTGTVPSPQISYKPKHVHMPYRSSTDHNWRPALGAVANLAIDGGLSADQLLHIGQTTSQPGPVTVHTQPTPDSHVIRTPRFGRSPPYNAPGQQRFCRPTCQSTSYCTTRASQSPDWPRGQHWSRARPQPRSFGLRNPAGIVTSTTVWHTSSRRGSFPLQMTRVGGLVVHPTASSSPDSVDFTTSKHPREHPLTYQSMSACTSPTSGKHANTSSSSPSTTFFSTSVPSPLSTPPLYASSQPTSFPDIVRLGPGDTVVHAAPGDTIYNVTDLIRMHDCPQPYVSHQDEIAPSATFDGVADGEFVCTYDRVCPPLTAPPTSSKSDAGPDSNTNILPKSRTNNISNQTAGDVMDFRHSTPDHFYRHFNSPQISHTPRTTTGFSSPPGPQVARTVRHLRRIRHIFGNPLDYGSSNTSASLGALVLPSDKDVVGNSTNSLVELRPHGSRSADSVRPASYTCKCPPDSIPFFQSAGDQDTSAVVRLPASLSCTAMVRFEQLQIGDKSPSGTPWERYYLRRTDDVLIMTRLATETSSTTTSRHQTLQYPYLAHLHVPLAGETISWQTHMDESLNLRPDECQYADPVIGQLDILLPEQHLKCQLIVDRQLALHVFGSWGPTAIKSAGHPESEDTHERELSAQSGTTPRRAKPVTGRSSSLGVAGPAGGLPLFRAVGTAAASVGMSLTGRAHLRSWLQTGSSSTKTIEISNPIAIENPTESANGGMKKPKNSQPISVQTTPEVSTTEPSKKQTRTGRGWFHQALHPMRRAATASDDPCAQSRTSKMTSAARRFASSHGILIHSKSTTVTQSDAPAPQSEKMSQIEADSTSSLCVRSAVEPITAPPVLLLAASVSPTPALQSPYVTYLSPAEIVDFQDGSRSSPMPSISSHEDLLKAPTMMFAGSSSEIDSGVLSEHSATASTTERIHHVMTVSETFGMLPSFVPLPQPLDGPLPLHKCPRSTLSPFVPFIVELCVTLVERYGLNCVGLYRLSGSKTAHDFISLELRKPLPEIDIQSDKWNDIHAICGVLKTFLRSLPDSLFPKVMYTEFLHACRNRDREKRLLSIQRLLGIMECYPGHPEYRAHRATLRYLATHLARVSAKETVNKMTTYNLALVFAPNLVQPREDTPELLMTDSKYKILLVETVIKYHSWIFSPDLGIESGCSIPTDSIEELPSVASDLETTLMRGPTECGPLLIPTNSMESEEPAHQPGRVEGDIQPLLAKLLHAAADLPPPPSDTDLETAVEPGPESDRPSDIAVPIHRPRFTSIPTSTWSVAALRSLDSSESVEQRQFQPELRLTQEIEPEVVPSADDPSCETSTLSGLTPRPRFFTSQLGTKLDNLRHLSQGCLDQYTNEARQLGERVAESRRQLETIVAQRLHAEQLLQEARNQSIDQLDVTETPQSRTQSNATGVRDSLSLATQEENQSEKRDNPSDNRR